LIELIFARLTPLMAPIGQLHHIILGEGGIIMAQGLVVINTDTWNRLTPAERRKNNE
jgi:hypothetical protein